MRSNGSLCELLQNVGKFRRYLYLLCAVDRTFRVRVHVGIAVIGSAVTVETVKELSSHVRAKLASTVHVRTRTYTYVHVHVNYVLHEEAA